MKEVKDYTKILEQKGAERTRLTRQLQIMLSKVAADIAESVPVGTAVTVDDTVYRIHNYKSNIGNFRTVVIVDPTGEPEDIDDDRAAAPIGKVALDDYAGPGEGYFLHRCFGCHVQIAERDEFLHFANNLPEIVQAFEAKEDLVIAGLRGAFEKLRALAE